MSASERHCAKVVASCGWITYRCKCGKRFSGETTEIACAKWSDHSQRMLREDML